MVSDLQKQLFVVSFEGVILGEMKQRCQEINICKQICL